MAIKVTPLHVALVWDKLTALPVDVTHREVEEALKWAFEESAEAAHE